MTKGFHFLFGSFAAGVVFGVFSFVAAIFYVRLGIGSKCVEIFGILVIME